MRAMKVNQIRETIGLFLRDLLLKEKIGVDELQEYSQFVLNNFIDGMEDKLLLERVKALDDDKPVLSPVVLKLLGEWSKG